MKEERIATIQLYLASKMKALIQLEKQVAQNGLIFSWIEISCFHMEVSQFSV